MNNYKYLYWAGTATLVMLALFLVVATKHLGDTAATANTISFSGEGKISAKPDIAAVSFSIVTEAATSKAAQDANSVKSNKVTDFLKKQGVADKDVKTSGYNVYPQYSNTYKPCVLNSNMMAPSGSGTAVAPSYPCSTNQQQISGYQVTQSFEVKVRNLDNVGVILDGLVAAGANQVNNLGFQIDNPEALKDQARALAIADAKTKANNLRKQLGIGLGKIVNYSEGNNYPIYFAADSLKSGGGGVAPAPSIPTGENEITVDVNITYQIR